MRKVGGRLAAALCALAVCLSCEQKPSIEMMGIIGGAVSLEPKVKAGTNMTDISWKKGKDLVAEWDPALWVAPRFQGRLDLDSVTGSLTLIKLRQNDSGQYNAEVVEGNEIQCTSFSLRILGSQIHAFLADVCQEPPKPPQLNCTAIGDRIQVRCELEGALYPAEKITLSYGWKYQRSNKPIPGNSTKIYLEKDVDLSENITCIIHVLDADTSSSIRLRDCIPPGAASQRNKAWLLLPFLVVAVPIALVAIYWWRGGRFTCRRNGKTQECEDGTNAAGAPPEEQRLREECSGNLEENGSKDGTSTAGAPPEEQCLREEYSGNLEENGSKGPSDPVT